MSAKTEVIRRCACGRLPAVSVKHAGGVRLYKVVCFCGAGTDTSEDESDVVTEWNQTFALTTQEEAKGLNAFD